VTLTLQPIFRDEAFAFIDHHHRHHPEPLGWIVGVAVNDGHQIVGVAVNDGHQIVGVATVGRPVARGNQDGWTAEVTRCCVLPDLPWVGPHSTSACSMLYRACWRAVKALGYRRLVTYTMVSESGASLRAASFVRVAEVDGRSWDCPSRPRTDKHVIDDRVRWEIKILDGEGKYAPPVRPAFAVEAVEEPGLFDLVGGAA
jgi:hypothetical protein